MAMKEREGYHKRVMEKEFSLEKKRENAAMINRVSRLSGLKDPVCSIKSSSSPLSN